ncbi:MAG: hypothetical protein HYX69_17870 [Planctomycetia bacterium]|nr:hypothetical protein [Planctomycetia bacterium]
MNRSSIPIQLRVTCPHCWSRFAAEDALWISQHPDLVGDPRLGTDQQQRFLPTRFTVEGAAIDSRGFACHGLACPKCHLTVPRALFEMEPLFISILGAPSCGKSYFLAAMSWQLRKTLPHSFCMAFSDADPAMNHYLNEYEEIQFLNPNQDQLVAIRKTEEQGDLYDTVLYGEQAIRFPRPFIFALRPLEGHVNYGSSARISKGLALYDNAGESFLPGSDTAASPVTRHLALSRALMFLFDPTQDRRFREACRGKTDDPQMQERSARLDRERPVRQDTILLEAADRVRRYAGLAQAAKHSRPLIVVVTKYDCWASLLDNEPLDDPWVQGKRRPSCALDKEVIQERSQKLRKVLWQLTPEIVAAAEGFAQQVIYIPVSAIGRSPESDPQTGALGIRPRDIHPRWAEVPLLYFLAHWCEGMIPYRKPKTHRIGPDDDNDTGTVPFGAARNRRETA